MNLSPTTARLNQILRESVETTLAAYGVGVDSADACPATQMLEHDAVGVIGFVGPHARGTLVFATTAELVARVCPLPDLDEDRTRDWLGELANLVLGRVKFGLGQYGLDIGLGLPVAITGQRMRIGAAKASRTRAWDLHVGGAPLRVWLDVEFSKGITIEDSPPLPIEPAPGCGDTILF